MRRFAQITLFLSSLLIAHPVYAETCSADRNNWADLALLRSITKQLGLPDTPHPVDNPPTVEKITLGRKLFFDRRLSINQTMSCAMCHIPEQGFTSNELRTAIGVEGRSVKRNSPTVLNVGFLDVLFHDGRDFSLETQYVAPLTSRVEMANPSAGSVVSMLNDLEEYQSMFDAAFGAPASLDRIGMALGSYQRTLVAADTAFDRWYFGGQPHAMTAQQIRGFDVFDGKGGCTSCHLIEDDYAVFTDQLFHDTGYGWQREQERQNPPETVPIELANGVFVDVDFSVVQSVGLEQQSDFGRYEVTEAPEDLWKIRTSPLRNVALTAPYMHDGNLSSLRDVIEFYNQGVQNHPQQDQRIQPLDLSNNDINDLEAFLRSLTASSIDCLITEARILPPDNY